VGGGRWREERQEVDGRWKGQGVRHGEGQGDKERGERGGGGGLSGKEGICGREKGVWE
jgi:hypothetical protein